MTDSRDGRRDPMRHGEAPREAPEVREARQALEEAAAQERAAASAYFGSLGREGASERAERYHAAVDRRQAAEARLRALETALRAGRTDPATARRLRDEPASDPDGGRA